MDEVDVRHGQLPRKGPHIARRAKIPATLLLLLEDVDGVNENLRRRINTSFKIRIHQSILKYAMPHDAVQRISSKGDCLLLMLEFDDLKSIQDLSVGEKIVLQKIVFRADDFGGECDYDSLGLGYQSDERKEETGRKEAARKGE